MAVMSRRGSLRAVDPRKARGAQGRGTRADYAVSPVLRVAYQGGNEPRSRSGLRLPCSPVPPIPLDLSTSFIQSIRNLSGFRCELETLLPAGEFSSFPKTRTAFRVVHADRISLRAECDTLTGVLVRDVTLLP